MWGAGPADGPYEWTLKGIDYHYCKGCMRCVESCPTAAMSRAAEVPGLAERARVALFPGLVS